MFNINELNLAERAALEALEAEGWPTVHGVHSYTDAMRLLLEVQDRWGVDLKGRRASAVAELRRFCVIWRLRGYVNRFGVMSDEAQEEMGEKMLVAVIRESCGTRAQQRAGTRKRTMPDAVSAAAPVRRRRMMPK